MGARIAIMGAGAVGCYAGAHMAQAGEDVTFIDMWPEHVEQMRNVGLTVSHARDVEPFTVKVKALHLTELQECAKQAPFDIAFVCTKSYDTAWATTMVAQYLAPGGFVVSLQNCMNEETVAGVVGWGKTLGCIASQIMVELRAPGDVIRGAGKGGAKHTVFRVGEVHGRVTDRAKEVTRLVAYSDSALTTENLWGERWSKLVANSMMNGMSASTGLGGNGIVRDDDLQRFSMRLGAEAIRIGQALGYSLEEVYHLDPEKIAAAGEGDAAALADIAARQRKAAEGRSDNFRPSMGQDMNKGRRTEIEFLNGYVVRQGEGIGLAARANAALTDIVKRVEKGELKPDPQHIKDLRLN
ncbi:MAG: 2-dehydropantoate 2-reductase [Alphaproteobacteria bacterium]